MLTPLSINLAGDVPSSVSRRCWIQAAVSTVATSAAVLAADVAPASAKPQRIKGGGPIVTLDDGAQYQDMTLGDGAEPNLGDRVAIHYSLFYKGESFQIFSYTITRFPAFRSNKNAGKASPVGEGGVFGEGPGGESKG